MAGRSLWGRPVLWLGGPRVLAEGLGRAWVPAVVWWRLGVPAWCGRFDLGPLDLPLYRAKRQCPKALPDLQF